MSEKAATEWVSCALCGANDYQILANEALYGVQVRNVVCRQCGLVYINPRMREPHLRAFYRQGYREREFGQSEPSAEFLVKAEREATVRLGWAGRCLRPSDSIAEIGCGTGHFLKAVSERIGCRVEGIEPIARYADCACHKGIKVQRSFLEDVPLQENSYQAIALFHVMEHLDDPLDSLRRLRRALVREGLLILEVPNILRPWCYLIGFLEDVHLYNFSPVTLAGMLRKAGFRLAWESDQGPALRCVARKMEQPEEWQPDPRHAGQVVWATRIANGKYIVRHPKWAIHRGTRNLVFNLLGSARSNALRNACHSLGSRYLKS